MSSEITEPFENEDRGEPLAEGGGGRALPSLDPSQQATSSNQAVDPIGVPGSVGPLPRQLTVSEMETCNWCGEYQKCTRWVKEWDNVHDDVENWPKGFQLVDNRLYFEGKLVYRGIFKQPMSERTMTFIFIQARRGFGRNCVFFSNLRIRRKPKLSQT